MDREVRFLKLSFSVWLTLGVLTFIIGTLVAMFPRNLPSAILRETVASILDIVQGIEREEENEHNKLKSDGHKQLHQRTLHTKINLI